MPSVYQFIKETYFDIPGDDNNLTDALKNRQIALDQRHFISADNQHYVIGWANSFELMRYPHGGKKKEYAFSVRKNLKHLIDRMR